MSDKFKLRHYQKLNVFVWRSHNLEPTWSLNPFRTGVPLVHHIADILNQDVSTQTLERLVRVELLCLHTPDSTRLASPDGDAVFALRGYAGRRGAVLLHVFDEDAADFAELVMALVEDAGLPLSYKDADTEEDFTDAVAFGDWLEGNDAPQTRLLFERLQDLL